MTKTPLYPDTPIPLLAYVALGANLGDRAASLRDAISRLSAVPGIEVTKVSSLLENPAVGGPADSPPFVNAVAEVRTTLDPQALLEALLQVERDMGRERREKWGPRVIDLDLILYGDRIIDTSALKVPHPLMHHRDFVLKPLAEIAPGAVHPVLKSTIAELAERMTRGAGGSPVLPPPAGDDAKPQLFLRPATNADGPAVRDLVFGVLREYGLKPDPCSTDLDLFDLEGSYAMKGGRFDVLVNAEGHVLGSVGLMPTGGGSCELRKMYLHRSARGHGWGRRMLDHAIFEARRMGFTRMTLETASVLKEAVAMYEKYGFRKYTPEHTVDRCDAAYELFL
ncbi:2-amino-4-hydroxy-6-hydroxymethyldihydropteridine diphosphokinase [Humisphaera borealis]|uniref:2-amino-4-hydroxy-6-hydroxymethyldihydropteridine pyrophosphokinase n=1 Tax=Humisphaera borealis TaxID=2807512 RepID=A0A7M2WVI0_9BACT|nr:2-amino-4-hydroxy-6-hydroxymethyldihydropteridine diphosphokinase [Humisphaera borealis]QOV89495.1 2-amino-4-hydroxy-6-hydroxymethyldihydropteridine diphosphokinase [Humisphaera borealis]